jgi:voltage-gated potassium channel
MTLVDRAGAAVLLVIFTLCLQCAGLALLIMWIRRALASGVHKLSAFRSAALVMQSTAAVIVLHGLQVVLWAGGYHWFCVPSWESAVYFSASSYATVGFAEAVLPSNWRLLGPVESLIGVLMCGVSVGLLFAVVTRLVGQQNR